MPTAAVWLSADERERLARDALAARRTLSAHIRALLGLAPTARGAPPGNKNAARKPRP